MFKAFSPFTNLKNDMFMMDFSEDFSLETFTKFDKI